MTVLFKKKVLVMGLGLFGGGLGVTRFLVREGARVTVTDLRSEEDLRESVEALKGLPVSLKLGGHDEADFLAADLIVANPAVPRHSEYLSLAERAGIPVTTEINLFFERCRGRIMGVTGSSGKTTTTLLAGEILRKVYPETRVGGNLGRPLIEEVDGIPPDAPVVLELSSFQLDRLGDLGRSPNLAVVTNFAPNHLDIHGSLGAYKKAKQGILLHQREDDGAVLNADDPEVWTWACLCAGQVHGFSVEGEVERGAFLRDSTIFGRKGERTTPVCPAGDLVLPGRHNIANALSATAAVQAWGVGEGPIAHVLRTFRGARHRLELIAEVNGVRYINDSIATTPDRTVAALHAYATPILLIAGGYDKGLSYEDLVQVVVSKVRHLFLLGPTADRITSALEKRGEADLQVHRSADLSEAVQESACLARPGEIVLLSPASASYDAFRNFQERGDHFVTLVKQLQNLNPGA